MTVQDPGTTRSARRELLLAIADDELITGHRSSHWTGVAPSIEEDLAFSTLAQDEINHADAWYQVLLAGEDGEVTRDAVDALALGRRADEYRHAVLCERPPRDFAYSLARHWLYDHFDVVRLDSLADSSDHDVAALATRLLHEERYHLEHADLWFRRLTRATAETSTRFRDALAAAIPEALGLFEAPIGESEAVASGLLPDPHATLFTRWAEGVVAALDDANLDDLVLPELRSGVLPDPDSRPAGRHGIHTDDFTVDVWPEMTHLHRAFPGAIW